MGNTYLRVRDAFQLRPRRANAFDEIGKRGGARRAIVTTQNALPPKSFRTRLSLNRKPKVRLPIKVPQELQLRDIHVGLGEGLGDGFDDFGKSFGFGVEG